MCVEQCRLTEDGKCLLLVVAHRRDGYDGSTQQHLTAVVGILPPCVRSSRTDPFLFLGRASDLDKGGLVRLLVFLFGGLFMWIGLFCGAYSMVGADENGCDYGPLHRLTGAGEQAQFGGTN